MSAEKAPPSDLNQLCVALKQLKTNGASVVVCAHVSQEEMAALATLTGARITTKWEEGYSGPRVKMEIDRQIEGVTVVAYCDRKPTAEDWQERVEQAAKDAATACGLSVVK